MGVFLALLARFLLAGFEDAKTTRLLYAGGADVFKTGRHAPDRGRSSKLPEARLACNSRGRTCHLPMRRSGAVTNHSGRTRHTSIRSAGRAKETRNEFAHSISNPNSLKVRQANRAMLSPSRTRRMRPKQHRRERGGMSLHFADKTARGLGEIATQIMMVMKGPPCRSVCLPNLKFNRRSGPKRPP